MNNRKNEYFTVFKQYMLEDFRRVVYKYIFYRLFLILSIILLLYCFLRVISLIASVKTYLILSFYYISTIFGLLIFIIGNYNNYIGKFLRKIDIKTLYESYIVIRNKDKNIALFFSSVLEDNVFREHYKKLKIDIKWKILLIVLILIFLLFLLGSIFSFYLYGKIVYKIVPSELKEVLTIQSIVEKLLNQIDEESDQYKYLSKLYEDATTSFSKEEIKPNEYIDKLNQILKLSLSLEAAKSYQDNKKSLFLIGENDNNKNNQKGEYKEKGAKLLGQKHQNQIEEDETKKDEIKKVDINIKILTQDEYIKQSFLDFIKNQLSKTENKVNQGPAGYQTQIAKYFQNSSIDFSTILQSIYTSSSEFSYSLSNQLTSTEKIEIFNYILKQFNINNSNMVFDEELFYKLISLYLDQMKKIQNNK